MEPYSVTGRIRLSHNTFRLLYPHGYKFLVRGQITIKGKGELTTYFLIGDFNRTVSQPEDKYRSLLQHPNELISSGEYSLGSDHIRHKLVVRKYGQIHCIVKELVLEQYGEAAWHKILEKSNMDNDDHFLMFSTYPDSMTSALLKAVCDVSTLPMETLLKRFGTHFLTYCLRHGYDKMLQTLGSDIYAFLQNLDSLHSLLSITYKGIVAPFFRCDKDENGALLLHYYSKRVGFFPIVIGLVEAVSKAIFNQTATVTVISQSEEKTVEMCIFQHVVFKVDIVSDSRKDRVSLALRPPSELTPVDPVSHDQDSVIKVGDICMALPYHFVLDDQMRIRQCGDNIRRVTRITILPNMPFISVGRIVQPPIHPTIPDIYSFINAVFLIAIFRTAKDKSRSFLLKGQMIWLEHRRKMLFIGSPRLSSLDELIDMKVFLCDIPLYDATRELVLLNQQRIAEIDVAKALDETTSALHKTGTELEAEKRKTEDLLLMMLPKKVAESLMQGIPVKAEKFENCTILFSDIVTFTNIASACSPMDVVNMLNELYNRFDSHTNRHGVYKVETIGDAYMSVGGVPEVQEDHAECIADFALDIMETATKVKSPATGLPLQIRAGLHSGPVVAGVVGKKMPRYCLFGDTVNTASRMESHSLPGRIHLSEAVFRHLYKFGYVFKLRGEMEVKGKGVMTTYFLVGRLRYRVPEPKDSMTQLPTMMHPDPIVKERKAYLMKPIGHESRRSFSFLNMSDTSSCSSVQEVVALPDMEGTSVDIGGNQYAANGHPEAVGACVSTEDSRPGSRCLGGRSCALI